MHMTLLYYDCLSEFKRQFFKDLLTSEHLDGGQIKFDTLHYPDGTSEEEANFWGYQFKKNGKRFLLSSTDNQCNEVIPSEILPIKATNLQKVAHKGVVYYWIQTPVSAKFKPSKVMSFKSFLDKLSKLEHSNKKHQKLLWLMTLAQLYDRCNFRISTPPGFGKDSTIDKLKDSLVG